MQPKRLRARRRVPVIVLAGFIALVPPSELEAQDSLRLTLAGAVRLAAERSPALRAARLEAREATERVAEARAATRPQLAATASYTRELASANPFAGTDVLSLFGGQAPTEWLFWNEQARLDGDPATQPITLEEFRARQEAAFREAGVAPPGARDNPFAVENQFMGGLSFEQALLSPGPLADLRAAEAAEAAALAGARAELLAVLDTIHVAYMTALLAQERAVLLGRSVARASANVDDAARRVEQGVAAVPERLSAEVELANLQTDWIDAQTDAGNALDLLKFGLGLAITLPLTLTESLDEPGDGYAAAAIAPGDAMIDATARRNEIRQAEALLAAGRARADAARAARRPSLTAFADLNVVGNVPDDRTRVRTAPLQPFDVEEERRGIFSGDFWDFGANVGVRLEWNLFAGGRLRAQERLAGIDVELAEVRLEQVRDQVMLEVRQASREARAAAARARIQEENVARAERNYRMVADRVTQGVAVPLERRDASEQLDRSALSLAQARHDYLVARSRLLTAMGTGLADALVEEWLR